MAILAADAPRHTPRRVEICEANRRPATDLADSGHDEALGRAPLDSRTDAPLYAVSAYAPPRKLTLAELIAWNPPAKQTPRLERTSPIDPPDKAPLSSGTEEEISDLVQTLIEARAARGDRREMRVPTRRKGMRSAMFDVVGLHLRRLARRVMNDREKAGLPEIPEMTLAAAMAKYTRDECEHVIYVHEHGEQSASSRERRAWIDGDRAVDAVSRSAARYALDTWSTDYILSLIHI